MVKAGRNRVCTVSITIEWCEADGEQAKDFPSSLRLIEAKRRRHTAAKTRSDERPDQARLMRAPRTTSRLLPTDRIVLDALRAHMPQGKSVTPAVSIKELMAECMISRRQVQICLRRLDEKGIISRLTEGAVLGGQEGYRYRILKTSSTRRKVDK